MILTLYKTSSGNNVINKVLTEPETMNIFLRKDFDITNPVLKIEVSPTLDIESYNYFHLSELDRFYFIEDFRILNSTIWEIVGKCDVLETYKTEILNSFCKYRKPVSSGDFGAIEIDSTGKNLIQNLESDVEMVLSDNSILSVYGAV